MKQYINFIINTIMEHARDFSQAGLTPPQTVDVYMGQPDNPEDFEFTLPAVFIDYTADYDAEMLDISIHVLQDFMQDTENFAPRHNDGLCFLDFLTVIKRSLTGVKMKPVFGALRLYREMPVKTQFYNYHMLTLRCSLNTTLYNAPDRYTEASPITVKIGDVKLKNNIIS